MAITIENQAGKFVSELPFFSGLRHEDFHAFLDVARPQLYRKGEQLLRQGDAADRFFIVMSGWVKLSRHTDDGDEAVIAIFTRGDVFAEAAIFSGSAYPYTAEAAEDAKVLEILASVLEKRARENPELLKRVMASMSREIKNQQMDKEHIALMSTAQRVGCLLLRLSANMVGTGGSFTFPYDKSLAAAQLGMKPETFSRALAQLKEADVACRGSEVRVESFCALAKFCCKSCTAEPGDCCGTRFRAAKEMAVAPRKALLAPTGEAAGATA